MTQPTTPLARPPLEHVQAAQSPKHAARLRDEISYFDLLTPLVTRWRAVALCVAIGAAGGVGVALIQPPFFTATTTFTTQAPSAGLTLPAGIASLAGQLGVSLERSGNVWSPAFFVDLAEADGILRALLLTPFPNPDSIGNTRVMRLIDQLRVGGGNQDVRITRGLKALRAKIAASAGRTGIVTIAVQDRSPIRAEWIANHLVALLNKFNLEQLQFQSRQQRIFAEQRLAQAKQELHDAERAQIDWAESNRIYQQSPLLLYEKARLDRDVELKNEVMLTLTRAYEEARIAEARDVPTITILDRALPPAEKSGPRRRVLAITGTLLGFIAGTLVALLSAHFRRVAEGGSPAYEDFSTGLSRMRGEIEALLRPRRR